MHDHIEGLKIREKLHDLERGQQAIDKMKNKFLLSLKVGLSIVQGSDNFEKLNSIFGNVNQATGRDAIENYAQTNLNYPVHDVLKVKAGAASLWHKLNTPLAADVQAQQASSKLNLLTQPEHEERSGLVRKLSIALTVAAGFLGGAGMTVAIAGIALGSMAAVIALGWPIIIPIVVVGLIGSLVATLSYRFIKRRQEKAQRKIELATAQVTGLSSYFHEYSHRGEEQVKELQAKQEKSGHEIWVRLNDIENDLSRYELKINEDTRAIENLDKEIHSFHIVPGNFPQAKQLKSEVKQSIILVEDLKKRVHNVAIITGTEDEKIDLMGKIELVLAKARNDSKKIAAIFEKIHRELHEQQEVTKSPEEKVQKKRETIQEKPVEESEADNEAQQVEIPPAKDDRHM